MTRKPSYVELEQRVAELEKQAVEQKCRETALRESKELFEKTFESQKDAIFILDANIHPKITNCNPAAEKVFGYTRQEMPGRTTEFLHVSRAALEGFQNQLYSSIANQGFFHLNDFMMKRKDGTLFPSEHTVVPLENEKAERAGWVSVVRDITRRKKMEEAVRESEEGYRLLAENVSDVIWIRDMNLHLTYISPSVEKLTGYSVEEAMALTLAEAYTPHSIELAMEAFSEELSREKDGKSDPSRVRTIEMEGYRKDGAMTRTEAKMRFLRDSNGHPAGILGVSRDITERKQAEMAIRISEERYRSLVEDMPALVCRFLPDGTLSFVNSRYCAFFDKEREALVGRNFFQFIPEEDREKVKRHLISLDQARPIVTCEHRMVSPNGSIDWQQWTGRALFDEKGEVQEYQYVGMDITERKRAEQELQYNKLLLEKTINSLDEAIFLIDPETREIIGCNSAVERIFGYTEQEVIGHNTEFLHVDTGMYTKFHHELLKALDRDGKHECEFQMRRKDGKIIFTEHTVTQVLDDSGHRSLNVSVLRDITKRREAQRALEQSEERFRLLAESIDDVFWIGTPQFDKQIYVSPAYERIWGKTRESLYASPRSFFDSIHPEDRDRVIDELEKNRESVYAIEYRVIKPDGSVRWVLDRCFPVKDKHGKTVMVCGVATDHTERKEMEKKLLESEEKYRVLAESMQSSIFMHDYQGRFLYINRFGADLMGKTQAEVMGTNLTEWFGEEDAKRMISDIQLVFTGRHSLESEYTLHFMEEQRHFALVLSPIMSAEGTVTMVVGVAHDVTDLKRAKQKLQESESRMRALLDALTESLMLVDAEGTILVINDTAARRLGKRGEDCMGLKMNEYLPGDVAVSRKALRDRVLLSGKGLRFQDERQGKFYDSSTTPVFDEKGKVKELAIFARDITEEKHLLEALRKSEKHYRLVFEKAATGICIEQLDGTVIEVNEVILEKAGYTREELGRMNLSDLYVDPHDRTRLIDALRKEGSVRDWEVKLKRKDGTVYTALLNVEMVELDGREVLFTSLCDITLLREAEKSLKSREKQLEIRTKNLEEANTALRVLLNSREEDKVEFENKVQVNVKRLIEPYLSKLKNSGLDERQATYFEILESNLKDIVSPFATKLSSEYLGLTPKEIQVACLVREGKTTKEIGELLNSSISAIRFHRENVRRKIGLRNKKANLRSRLLSLK